MGLWDGWMRIWIEEEVGDGDKITGVVESAEKKR